MKLFALAAIILFILGLICLVAPTTIAGANWQTWDTAGLLATVLEMFLPAGVIGPGVWPGR